MRPLAVRAAALDDGLAPMAERKRMLDEYTFARTTCQPGMQFLPGPGRVIMQHGDDARGGEWHEMLWRRFSHSSILKVGRSGFDCRAVAARTGLRALPRTAAPAGMPIITPTELGVSRSTTSTSMPA
jgi:hypothetical protein